MADNGFLQAAWFFLVGVLLVGYAILDGFDLGVGMQHLTTARTDEERRILMNSIGPVWDGNEVWLITAGGALFAAFPKVYATVFSGFYLALMLVLAGLILRAVSLEFRSKERGRGWRTTWDLAFFVGSVLPPVIAVLALVAFPVLVRRGRAASAFAASSAAIAAMIATLGIGLWPNLLPARDQGASLTVPLTASSDLALTVMLIIALVGLPFVLAYTLWVYRTFRGPVRLDEHSY